MSLLSSRLIVSCQSLPSLQRFLTSLWRIIYDFPTQRSKSVFPLWKYFWDSWLNFALFSYDVLILSIRSFIPLGGPKYLLNFIQGTFKFGTNLLSLDGPCIHGWSFFGLGRLSFYYIRSWGRCIVHITGRVLFLTDPDTPSSFFFWFWVIIYFVR